MSLRAPSFALIVSVSLHAGALGLAVFVTMSTIREPAPPREHEPILVRWAPRVPQVPVIAPRPPEIEERGAPSVEVPSASAVTGLYRGSARARAVSVPHAEPGLPVPAAVPPEDRAPLVQEPALPPPSARIESHAPERISKLQPRYPRECRRRGHEGVVELELQIDVEGRVVDVRILRSGPCPHLDAAALETARGLRYRPARRDGQSHASRTTLRVRFALDR